MPNMDPSDGIDTIAVAPLPGSDRTAHDGQILSEAEINRLLREAETRLREAQKSCALQKTGSHSTVKRYVS